MSATSNLRRELRLTLERPARLGNLVRPSHLRLLAFRVRHGEPDFDGDAKAYRSYDHYVAHQRSKLAILDLGDYDRTFRAALADRLRSLDVAWPEVPVLCLAARIGTEVKAFGDVGAFALGVDLNPGDGNRYVVTGDFHDLQFPDGCVGAVYCNSLDHALDLDRVILEVRRVLRPGGLAIIEALVGTDERPPDEVDVAGFGRWEARRWARARDVAEAFVAQGFELRSDDGFTEPWDGRRFVLVRGGA